LLVDNCAELLAEAAAPAGRCRDWDLNAGLPPEARAAALLLSSFALHWLNAPEQQLRHWCEQLRPGGWLALAVPLQGSFTSWHQAAEGAGVACSALPLPRERDLLAALPPGCRPHRQQRLRFSCRYPSAMAFLAELKRHGVNGGASAQLSPAELRRLLKHWPMQEQDQGVSLNWDLLLLLACRDEP
jgi:malonyl-CoA O-methyltransferase